MSSNSTHPSKKAIYLAYSSLIGVFLLTPLLIMAPSLIYSYMVDYIDSTCRISTNSTSTDRSLADYCQTERRAVVLFAVFNLARWGSYLYEGLLAEFCKDCGIRKRIKGLHSGIGLCGVYLARELVEPLLTSHSVFGSKMVMYCILFVTTAVLLSPYIKDIVVLRYAIVAGYDNGKYDEKLVALVMSIASLTFHSIIVVFHLVHIPTGLLSEKLYICALPLFFPCVNFPLILYLLHSFVLRTHSYCTQIYQVQNEDRFIYARIAKCLNGALCIHNSQAWINDRRRAPSEMTAEELVEMQEKGLIAVDNYNQLDEWIRNKIDKPKLFNR